MLHAMELLCDAWCFTGLAVACFLAVVATATLHLVAWFPTTLVYTVIYAHNMDEGRTDQLSMGGAPFMHPEWIFFIWVAIYGYQVIQILYMVTFICRSVRVTGLLVRATNVGSLVTYLLGLGSLVAWNLLKGRPDTPTYFNCLTMFSTWVFTTLSHSMVVTGMIASKAALLRECFSDVISLRIFVINPLAALASWALLLFLQDVCQSLFLYAGVSTTVVQYVWVVTAAVLLGMWLLIQVLASESSLEYTISPYIVTLLAYASVIFDPAVIAQLEDIMKYVIYCIMFVMFIFMLVALAASVYKGRGFKPAPYPEDVAMQGDMSDTDNMPQYVHHDVDDKWALNIK